MYPNLSVPLSDQQQFRREKINEIKDYFVAEIKERELMSKRLSKYIASFDYVDKSLIVLSVTTDRISIASFATVIGALVGMESAIFSLGFSISTGIVKNCQKQQEIWKKHNIIVTLARSKLRSIESKISEALTNNEISHEDFMTIISEEKKYCLKCRKDTENINPRVSNTSNGKTMILSKCSICGSKKLRFIKNQEENGLLSNLVLEHH